MSGSRVGRSSSPPGYGAGRRFGSSGTDRTVHRRRDRVTGDPRRRSVRRGGPTGDREGTRHERRARPRSSIPGFGGDLLTPATTRYDEARAVFNGMIDRRPAMIARVRQHRRRRRRGELRARPGPAALGVRRRPRRDRRRGDRRRAVHRPARHEGRSRSTRARRRSRAEAGLNWGEFDAATQEHGLAVTGGRVPTPASPGSRSAAAAAGSSASSASPATTCSRPRS